MALEDKIDTLIAALAANTAAVKAATEVRNDLIEAAKGSGADVNAASEKKAAAAEKKAAEKAAADKATADKAAADKAAAAEKAAADKAAAAENQRGGDAYNGLKEIIAAYVGVDRPEERAARQQKVIALLSHEKIKKADLPADAKHDVSNIAPGAIELFKKQIAMLQEKGDLTVPEADALV